MIIWFFRKLLLAMVWLIGLLVSTYVILITWSLTIGYYTETFYLPNGMYLNRNRDYQKNRTTMDLFRTTDEKLLVRGVEWMCFNNRSISGTFVQTPETAPIWTNYGYSQVNLFVFVDANRERPKTKAAYETAMREAGMWTTQKNCYCHSDFMPGIFFSRLFVDMTEKECGPSGGHLD